MEGKEGKKEIAMDGKKEASPFEMMYRDRRARRIAHALLSNRMSAERVADCLTNDVVWDNALKLTEAMFKGKSGMNYKHLPSLDTRAWVIAYMAMDEIGRTAIRSRIARDMKNQGVDPRVSPSLGPISFELSKDSNSLSLRGKSGFGDWDEEKQEWEYPL